MKIARPSPVGMVVVIMGIVVVGILVVVFGMIFSGQGKVIWVSSFSVTIGIDTFAYICTQNAKKVLNFHFEC